MDLHPEKALELMEKNKGNKDLTVLDVCTEKEFSQRHLENAVNLSFISRTFKSGIKKLDKTKTYIV